MRSRSINFWSRTAGTFALAFATMHGVAYGQGQAMNGGQGQGMQIQTASACGNQPRCYDAPTFAAVITDFRTSEANGFKVIDVVIRYFNKTNQTRALGYVEGSAAATDDQGNRFVLNWYGGNGIRGMGIVNGNNIDPKFVLQPGGAADAHYELLWRPGTTVAGVSYTLDMSIREINALEGHQYSLGGEAPLHFEGLVNNVAGNAAAGQGTGMQMGQGAPMQGTPAQGMYPQGGSVQDMSAQGAQGVAVANGAAPCNPTANASDIANAATSIASQHSSSTTASTAANTTSQAASAVSSLGSLFKHKPAANTTAPANTASTNPCPAGSSVAGMANTANSTISGVQSGGLQNALGTVNSTTNTVASAYPDNAAYPGATAAPMNASVPMAMAGTSANACAGRAHCFQSGPIAAEVTSILPNNAAPPQDHAVRLNVTFRNLSNQPVALAYKSGSGHLQDEHGTGYYSARPGTHDTSAAGIGLAEGRNVNSSFVLRPGESRNAMFQLDSFDRGSKPMGTSFNYSLVVEQLQVQPNGQAQSVGEHALNFAGLTTGAANAVVPAVAKTPTGTMATPTQAGLVPASKTTPASTATPVMAVPAAKTTTAVPAVKTTQATAVPAVKTTTAVPAAKTTTTTAKKPATTTTTPATK